MNPLGSITGIRVSDADIELLTVDERDEVDAEEVVNPAFFASSAAKVERTDVIIYWDEVEAASLSATSAAIAAVDFLDV